MDSTSNQFNQKPDDQEKTSHHRRRKTRIVNDTNSNINDLFKCNISITTGDILAITKEIESFATMPLTNFASSNNPAILSEIKLENIQFLFGSLQKLTELLQHEVTQMIKFEHHSQDMSNKID
ncbi:UNVERIFIED_CONTAM: hypothetical protein MT382_02430 [Aeromonas salmonicida]